MHDFNTISLCTSKSWKENTANELLLFSWSACDQSKDQLKEWFFDAHPIYSFSTYFIDFLFVDEGCYSTYHLKIVFYTNLANSCREGTAKFADMENTSMTLGRHQRKKSSTSTLNKKKSVWDPSVSSYLLIVVLSNRKLAARHRVELKEFYILAQVHSPNSARLDSKKCKFLCSTLQQKGQYRISVPSSRTSLWSTQQI